MSRYIDVDAIEYHEIYDGQEFIRVAYGDDIDNILTVDVVEVKHGKWIKADTHNYWFFKKNDRVYKCSICGNLLNFEDVNGGRGNTTYCPNCGADMRGAEE